MQCWCAVIVVVGGREVEIEAMREEFGQLGCRETASRRRTASRWPRGSSRSRTGVSIRAGPQSLRAPQTRARVNLGVTPSTRRALGRAKIEDSTSVPPRGLGPGRGRPEGLCGGGRWWLGIDGVGILGDSGHAGGHGLENERVAAAAAAATLHRSAPPPPLPRAVGERRRWATTRGTRPLPRHLVDGARCLDWSVHILV